MAMLPGADQRLHDMGLSFLKFPAAVRKITLSEALTFHFLFKCYFESTNLFQSPFL